MSDEFVVKSARHKELLELLDAFGTFGETGKGGIARLAASPADGQVRDFLCDWFRERDFRVLVDEVGNIFGVLDLMKGPAEKHFFCGSHLDSQPEAGKFDGALGVACACIAALCLQESVKTDGLEPSFRYFVVCCWTGEEGARFQPSLVGSSVYSGAKTAAETLAIKDSDETSLAVALDTIGYRGKDTIPKADQYLELHIEQGTELERNKTPIALVTNCWGAKKIRLEFKGVPDHTGPTPMQDRRNALLAASHGIVEVEAIANKAKATLYSSVGRIEVQPNSPNTIAEHVQMWIEFRSPDEAALEAAEKDLLKALDGIERETGCTAHISSTETRSVVTFDKTAIATIEVGFKAASIPFLHLKTIAGHDAVRLQEVCPSTLLFAPSKDGITHSPEEFTADEDVCAGFDAMLDALSNLIIGPVSEQYSGRQSQ